MGQDPVAPNTLCTIAAVSHDAGASEILVAYINQHLKLANWKLYAKEGSPFKAIAQKNDLYTFDIEKFSLSNVDALFFGTGWQEKPERAFINEAKKQRIPCFAFLDHWSSYRERFDYPQESWEKNLPDFTVVSDKKAEAIANSYSLPYVTLIKNFYLQKQIENIQTEGITPTDNLLFLSEPTDDVALRTFGSENYWGFTQVSALEDILTHFEKFNCSGLHIRLHPSEKNHAFKKVLKKFPHIKSQIYPSDFIPLEKDLLRSKMIIGFDTMALYTAALIHKACISYLPSANREFLLPLPSSHQLRSLSKLKPVHLKPLYGMDLNSEGTPFARIEQLIKGFNT